VKISIRRLEPHDDRTAFRSGNIELDRFFARYAGQNQFRHHIGTTYVAVDEGGRITGFATVAASELATSHVPETKRRRLPAYPIPVLRLARRAVALARLALVARVGDARDEPHLLHALDDAARRDAVGEVVLALERPAP